MKAIIAGKRYDTEATGTKAVASYSYGSPSDFHHVRETLCLTGKGAWFTAGCGGPMSPYAERVGQNETSGGSAIRPMSADEAQVWLERHDETEALETYFSGEVTNA